MTPEQAAAFVNAQTALLNAKIAGMNATNMRCALRGEPLTFVDTHYNEVLQQYEGVLGHNAVLSLFHPG